MTLSQLTGEPEADQQTAAWIAAHGTPAPPGADCDATIVPVVTGTINDDLLGQLPAGLTSSRGLAGRAARQLTIAHAVKLLSGPDGLAGWLRTRQHTGLPGAVSLPLDIGAATDTIPAHLRRAVASRRPALPVPRLRTATRRLPRPPPDPPIRRRADEPG